jgi:hypothetical protein
MSKNSKKSMAWMLVLILFGIIALFGGTEWAIVLIPAAVLIWYGSAPLLRGGRN